MCGLAAAQAGASHYVTAKEVVNAKAATGPHARAVLMCRYSDSPTPSTKTKAHFEGLFALLSDYWGEASYGKLDMSYVVYDWRTIGARSAYGTVPGDGVNMDEDAIAGDCADVHDAAGLDFTQFDAIDIVLDEDDGFDAAGVGGYVCGAVFVDGEACWPLTWVPGDEASPDGNGLALWAHEGGHSLGLPHTYRVGGTQWFDPMGFPCGGSFASGGAGDDPTYGCMPVHYLAAHKDKDFLGWIDNNRREIVKPGKTKTVSLERLALPADNGRPLIARMPIKGEDPSCYDGPGDPKNCKPYYAAEVRMGVPGSLYDSPAQLGDDKGVVISKVTTGCRVGEPPCEFSYLPVQVQSKGGDDEPQSSMWEAGESFKAEGIKVKVLQNLSQGFKVKIINKS
jgi:M6 family metalloprotease-like protein